MVCDLFQTCASGQRQNVPEAVRRPWLSRLLLAVAVQQQLHRSVAKFLPASWQAAVFWKTDG